MKHFQRRMRFSTHEERLIEMFDTKSQSLVEQAMRPGAQLQARARVLLTRFAEEEAEAGDGGGDEVLEEGINAM